jgi:hypothetical protein
MATAEGATEISQTTSGAFTARSQIVQVVAVNTNPGCQVDVTVSIVNAVNRQQQAPVSYVVKDASGNILFPSPAVSTTLNVLNTLSTVDLGNGPGFARTV